MNLLDIIIPVYNQEELIIRALNSIPKRKDIKIIIVDDCSIDNTLNNVILWQNEHKNEFFDIQILSNEFNVGCGVSKNKACKLANGEYLYIMDSDDYLLTSEFNNLLNNINDYKNYDIIRIDNEINNYHVEHSKHTAGWSYILKNRFNIEYPILRKTDDWEFWKALLAAGAKTIESNCLCYHYNYPRKGSIVWNYKNGVTDWKGDPIE